MSIVLSQTLTAITPGLKSSFLATGGTVPYVYSVRANGAGGSINSSTGVYTAPAIMGSTPQTLSDTIQVIDNVGVIATSKILVGNALFLFCDILQTYLSQAIALPAGRVYLWDQKVLQPNDSGLYIAVSVISCKPFGSNKQYDGNGNAVQFTNMLATLDLDVISRGPAARDQKEFIILALLSDYSESQQEANSFSIGRLPPGAKFLNISNVDGAAIPYRFKISVNMQYSVQYSQATPYFNQFSNPTVYTNP